MYSIVDHHYTALQRNVAPLPRYQNYMSQLNLKRKDEEEEEEESFSSLHVLVESLFCLYLGALCNIT